MDILPSVSPNSNPVKHCPRCEKDFPATPEFFQRDKHRKDGLYSYCKECVAKRRNRPDVRERKLAYNHAYYSDSEKHDRILAQRKDNYHNDLEIRQQALDYNKRSDVREYQRAYLKVYNRTPGAQAKRKVSKHARRAREKAVLGTHTSQQIQDLLKRQKHKCYYCNVKFERKDGKYFYHVEHTFPISRVSGTNIPANDISYVVLACPSCDRNKSNKFPWEFFEGGRLL